MNDMRPSPRRSGVIFERSLRPPIADEGGAYAHRLPIKPNITTGNDECFVQQQAQRQASDVRRPMTDLGRNIRDLLLQGSSVVVPAVAGSGKTSLALSVVQHLAPSQQRATLFLAFNREVIERLRPHVSLARMTTIHGLALRALGIMHPDLRVDGRKLHRIIESVIIRNRQHARLAHHVFDTEMSRKILADDLHALAVRMITRQESALMAAYVHE